jgi:Toprim-like
MFDILSIIPGKRKLTGSGWHSFNAVCCHHRGHKADRRSRGGIKFDGTTNWSMHCFNCGFKCGFRLGTSITKNTKQLLIWCGVDETQIQKWSMESVLQKDFVDLTPKKKEKKIKFKDHELPDADLLDQNNILHKVYVEYLSARGISSSEYPFMITPNEQGRMGNRIIIPYTYKNKIVGHTSRFLDNKIPKYINEQQPGYVFGYDFQKSDQSVCILVEGIFDALSLGACALTHNTINDEQAELLAQLNRKIIFVPDHDKTGLATCDRALELGYSVSIPYWDDDVKDVNDAVVKYGRLATLLSILESATMNKIKIEIQRNKIVRKL